eukprot:UN00225
MASSPRLGIATRRYVKILFGALVRIAEKGDKAVIEMLIPLLTQEQERTCRRHAVEAIMKIAKKGDMQAIQCPCRNTDARSRWNACRGSGVAIREIAEKGDMQVIKCLASSALWTTTRMYASLRLRPLSGLQRGVTKPRLSC